MKTKLLKVSKCTLSLVLSLMMLFSSVFVSSGVTTTATAADAPDATAADMAQDTAQADDTSAPTKSAAPAKVTPQASGATAADVTIYFDGMTAGFVPYINQWGGSTPTGTYKGDDQKMDFDISTGLYYKSFNGAQFQIYNKDSSSPKFAVTDNISNYNNAIIWGTNSSNYTTSQTPTEYATSKGYTNPQVFIEGGIDNTSVWKTTDTNYPMTETSSGSKVYCYDTSKTVQGLKNLNNPYFFFVVIYNNDWNKKVTIMSKQQTSGNNYFFTGDESGTAIDVSGAGYNFSFANAAANWGNNVKLYLDNSQGATNFYYTATGTEYTVYFRMPNTWSADNLKMYLFTNATSTNNTDSAWPGYSYTYTTETVRGDTLYKFTFQTNRDGLIFTNSDSVKTDDLELSDNTVYYYKDDEWKTKSIAKYRTQGDGDDATYTLYFDALDSGWTPSANVYDTSDNNADVLATTAMTKYSGTSANIYSVTFSTAVDVGNLEVKFSNKGATPTSGYAVADGKVYRYDGTAVTDSITDYIANNYAENIYFEKPVYIKDNTTYIPWTTAKAYIFTGRTGDGTAWPGHDMNVDAATGLYRFDVTNNTNTGVIFNNGDRDGVDNQNKTADLTLTPGKVYKFDGTTYDYDDYKNQIDDWYVLGVDSSEVQMSPVSGTENLYVYNTKKTISQLTGGITFRRKYNNDWIGDALGATSTTGTSKENYYLTSSVGNGSGSALDAAPHGYYFNFSNYGTAPAGTVKLYLDVSSLGSPKFYYEVNSYTITNIDETATSYTFYLDNSECGWDAPAAYAYSNPDASTAADVTSELLNATWPGQAMTFDTTKNLWKITVSLKKQTFSDATLTSQYPQVIFTDKFINAAGKEIKTGMHQTSAQQLVDGKVYKIASNGTTITTAEYSSYSAPTTPALTYYVHNTSSGTDTEMTETADGSGIYKLSTGKTIAQLSDKTERFYILEKGYRGNISHRRPSNTELDQFDRNDKFETHERASGYFFFNDSSVTAGNVDLYYQPSTEKFWYTFATDPTFYTVTAADATTKSALGFEEKSYVAGSTAALKIVRIPEGKAVDTVTVGGSPLTPNSSGEYTFIVDAAKTVTVTLRDKYTFSITMTSTDNAATVTASQYKITEGEQIKINAIKGVSDSWDYTFNNWSATGCDLKFVNSKETDAAAVVIPTANSSTTDENSVANITITANYDKTPLVALTGNDARWVAFGPGIDLPSNFTGVKPLKSMTVDGTTKYFVDFVKSEFNNKDWINFSLTTENKANTPKKFVNWNDAKTVSSTNTKIVTGKPMNHGDGNNQNEYTVQFAQMEVKDWDSLIAARLYVDSINGNTYTFEPIFQEIEKKDKVGNVKFYVKDGTIRNNYQKYTDLADSTVTNNSSSEIDTGIYVTDRSSYSDRAEYGYGNVGATLSIKTTIQNAYVNKYYVKGFCINGITYNVIDEPAAGDARRIKSGEAGYDESQSGVYTLDYVLPANADTVEITPIYFYFTDSTSDMVKAQPNVKFITFYAEDFDKQVQNTWGTTLAVHAWYSGNEADEKTGGANSNKNTLGGYPGQPMVFANGEGRYYMQIPTLREDGKSIQGVTMNNYDWDDTHAYVTWGVTGTDEPRQAKNCQTYDYDDFAALAYYGAEEIFFTFKYRTNTDNPSDNAALMNKSYYGNGWDAFVDHESRGVDLFGNRLKKSDTLRDDSVTYQSKDSSNTYLSVDSAYLTEDFIESANCDNKIYITSDGYVNYESNSKYRYLGKYATKWTIYKKETNGTFTKIGALPSSAFVPPMDGRSYKLNDDGEMITAGTDGAANKALFLAYSGTSGTARETEWSDFVTIYNACHHLPAVITYEIAKVDSNQPGLRNDGRWYYSKEAERVLDIDLYSIVGNIQIEYKNIDSSGYTTDTISNAGLGSTTNATAKFTDTDKLNGSTDIKEITILDKTKNYNFHADAVSTTTGDSPKTYVFVGWFLKNGDNYTEINPSDLSNPDGSCPRISSETFVARYEEISGKTLIVNHTTGTYVGEDGKKNGSGKTYTTVKVYNPTTKSYIFNQTSEGAITVSPNYLTDDNYVVTIGIKAEADRTSRYNSTTLSENGEDEATFYLSSEDNYSELTYPAVDVKTLFGDTESKRIDYTSYFTFSTFTVYYCFYDRDTTHNAKIDIKQTPTKVRVDVPYAEGETISQIISNGLNENVTNGDGSMSKLSNILDKYYIWTTQTEAQGYEDENGNYVGGIADMYDISKTPVQKYSKTYKDNTEVLWNHFDSLGKPVTDDTYSADVKRGLDSIQLTKNWVNYGVEQTQVHMVGEEPKEITITNYVSSTEVEVYGTSDSQDVNLDLQDSLVDNSVAEEDYTPDNTNVSSVVVWAYNTPKTYNVNFIYPKADTEEQTVEEDGNQVTTNVQKYTVATDHVAINNVLTKSGYTDVYTYDYYNDNNTWVDSNWTRASLFYGQRLGESESGVKLDNDGNLVDKDGKSIEEITDARDLPGGHIQNYGVKLGFNDTKIEAVKEFTKTFVDSQSNEEIEKTLVFDGWYDIDSGAKITSDYNYGYRVTSDMTLVAGYKIKPEEAVTKTPRVTVTADDFDMYFENSGTDKTTMTEKMRFNTQLNVYDCEDSYYGNGKIEKIAAAYIQLRVQGVGTKYTTRSAYELANDSAFITALRSEISTVLNSKPATADPATGWFKYQKAGDDKAYSVAWKMVYTFKTAGDVSGNESEASLTSKNRTIFTMDIDASKHEENESISAMLVFGAIKIGDAWTLSDNFVKYINYDAPDEDEAGTEEPQGEDDGDGEEDPVEGGSVQGNP